MWTNSHILQDLRFSQQCHSGFKSSRIRCCVSWWVLTPGTSHYPHTQG